jgi:hypothetical protein
VKLRLRLGVETMPARVLLLCGVTVLYSVIVVALALLSAATGHGVSDVSLKWTLLLQLSVLLPLPLATMAQLVEMRWVSLSRVWPSSALRQDVRGVCHVLWLAWALVALPALVLALLTLGSSVTLVEAGVGPALAALTLAMFALQGAAWQGLIHPAWLLAPGPAIAWLAARGWDTPWTDLLAFGPLGMAIGLLSLPGVLMWLQQRLAQPLQLAAGPTPRTPRQWFAEASGSLGERWHYVDARQGGPTLAIMVPIISLQVAIPNNVVLVPWGSEVTGWYGLRILLLAAYVTTALRSRDLHWRWLLAPTGAFRHQLGQRIVASTLGSLAVILCVVGLVELPLMHWIGLSWSDASARVLSYGAPLALDLVLATALAAGVRGLSPRYVWSVLALSAGMCAWVLVGWLAGLSFWPGDNTALWHRDATFAAATLGLAAFFTLLANRIWARADLGQIFRQASPNADKSEWRLR